MRLCRYPALAALAGVTLCVVAPLGSQTAAPAPDPRKILDQYCVNCHNQKLRTAGLEFDRIDVSKAAANAEVWGRVIAKLRAGSMPPPGLPRPDAATYRALAATLEREIDRVWLELGVRYSETSEMRG
jgi:hypothetical protein